MLLYHKYVRTYVGKFEYDTYVGIRRRKILTLVELENTALAA